MAGRLDITRESEFIRNRLGCDFTLYVTESCYADDRMVTLMSSLELIVYSIDEYMFLRRRHPQFAHTYLIIPNNVDQAKYRKDAIYYINADTTYIYSWKNTDCMVSSRYNRNKYQCNNDDLLDLWCAKIKKIAELQLRGVHVNSNIMLHGKPGTGKTRFAISLAIKSRKSISIVDPRNGHSFQAKTVEAPIFLFEEIDKLLMPNGDFCGDGLLVDQLLQFLDGGLRPPGSVILMTCNDYEKVKRNKVLSRKGRITGEIEFGCIVESDCKFVCDQFYEGADHVQLWNQVKSANLTIADLSAFVSEGFLTDKPFAELISEAKSLKAESAERLTHYY